MSDSPPNLAELAFRAGRSGDSTAVLARLAAGAEVDAPDCHGCTGLARAAQFTWDRCAQQTLAVLKGEL